MPTTDNCLAKYAPEAARHIARTIVRRALAKGWTISVNDGEEWTVTKSTKRAEILDAMATTDMDKLAFFAGECVGVIMLIYCNDSECICDYTDNECMAELTAGLGE